MLERPDERKASACSFASSLVVLLFFRDRRRRGSVEGPAAGPVETAAEAPEELEGGGGATVPLLLTRRDRLAREGLGVFSRNDAFALASPGVQPWQLALAHSSRSQKKSVIDFRTSFGEVLHEGKVATFITVAPLDLWKFSAEPLECLCRASQNGL